MDVDYHLNGQSQHLTFEKVHEGISNKSFLAGSLRDCEVGIFFFRKMSQNKLYNNKCFSQKKMLRMF